MTKTVSIPKTSKVWTIFSFRLASRLVDYGHKVKKIARNTRDLNLKVYTFYVDDTFEEDLNKGIVAISKEKEIENRNK